jgi:GMP synthase-like glutamine amidotransferase
LIDIMEINLASSTLDIRADHEPRADTRVVIVGLADDAQPGLLLDAIRARGLGWQTVGASSGALRADPSSASAAIVLGSPGSAANTEHGWSPEAIDWLRAADAAGTAILGVGTGAQALAVALGGGVEPAPAPVRGWRGVSTAAPQIVAPGPWLTWHDDTLLIPPGGELLAYSDDGPQAFRVENHIGVHFYPYATPGVVRDWVYRERTRPLDSQGLLEATSREFARASTDAHELLAAFALEAELTGP